MLDKVKFTVDKYMSDGVKLFLFYDFDGVFNAMYRSGTFKKDYYNLTHKENHPNPHYNPKAPKFVNGVKVLNKEPKSYPLAWSKDLVEASNDLTNNDSVQVVWLTTWRGHMKDVSDRLGFTYSRNPVYLPWGNNELSSDHFSKIDAFLDYFKGFKNDSVGVAWVDDVVHKNADLVRREVFDVSSFTDDNLLLLCPNDWYGLSRDDMNLLNNFSSKFVN